MRRIYKKNGKESKVIYGESLNRLINQKSSFSLLNQSPSTLIISTQSFYEHYYDKLSSLFNDNNTFNWYICPNITHINSINTYQNILNYIEEMKLPMGTSLVVAGDDKIYYLCSFLAKSSIYLEEYTYVPTTMTGFIAALKGKGQLVNEQNMITSECFILPERMIYDTMLSELEAPDRWSQDFFQLLKLSLFSSKELFDLLSIISYREKRPWTPYIELVIECLEKETFVNEQMIDSVKKGFYQLTESHYMTLEEKEQISFLLYFLWCLKKEGISFDFTLFVQWLNQALDSSLRLPKVMNTYDLAESIMRELRRIDKSVSLNKMGSMKISNLPTLEEIYHVIENYREI